MTAMELLKILAEFSMNMEDDLGFHVEWSFYCIEGETRVSIGLHIYNVFLNREKTFNLENLETVEQLTTQLESIRKEIYAN